MEKKYKNSKEFVVQFLYEKSNNLPKIIRLKSHINLPKLSSFFYQTISITLTVLQIEIVYFG